MKLEDQVCSLDLAKRLKELGVRQESYFKWSSLKDVVLGPLVPNDLENLKHHLPNIMNNEAQIFAAFTVAELGEMLPPIIEVGLKPGQIKAVLVIGPTLGDQWRIDYRNEKAMKPITVVSDTEANARAKMLIYLIEQGIVKSENKL